MPKATYKLPSAEYLHQCFDYDRETGVLRWRPRPREHFSDTRSFRTTTTRYAGRIAGCSDRRGYLIVHLDSKELHVSRIIYKMHHLIDPEFVDHIDRNKQNNRLENLRSATNGENMRNRIQKIGLSGFPGVRCSGNNFQARIRIDRKHLCLGTFKTAEEAHAVYRDTANRLFGEFSPFNNHC